MRTRVMAAVVAVMIVVGGDAVQPLSRMTTPAKIGAAAVEAADTGVRIGTVTAYSSGSITVAISGSDTLISAAYLSSYFPNIGDTVAILKNGTSWLVLGGFGQTQSRYIPVSAFVAAIETTSSVSYTDLATPGPAVTCVVGSSGQVLLSLNAQLITGNSGGLPTGQNAYASFTITDPSGNVSQYGDTLWMSAIIAAAATPTMDMRVGVQLLVQNLTPGSNTFTMKYRSLDTNSVRFGNRLITVTPY